MAESTIHATANEVVEELIAAARSASTTVLGIQRLADRLVAIDELSGVLDRALDGAEPDTAARLMMAAATAGHPPTAEQVAAVLPLISSAEELPILVGVAAGERVPMLIELVEGGQLSAQREALSLFLAVEILGDTPCPPRLLTQLRLVGRKVVDIGSRCLLGVAA